ncbi:hypothetical protein [Rhodococcus sp. NPDC057529]|uniref:hypothetical protein n=1 Tax=Rhodococcus sp. NPDC057529 TaxID=3346158 RepID=UPI00366F0ACE
MFEVRVTLSLAGRVEAERLGKHPPCANFSAEVRPMDSVMSKAEELDRVVGELVTLDEQRVGIGTQLVDLEHYFRKAGYPELSRRTLDAFMTRYLGRVLELADGMRE